MTEIEGLLSDGGRSRRTTYFLVTDSRSFHGQNSVLAMEAIVPRFRYSSAKPLRYRRFPAFLLPLEVHGHGQYSGHGNDLKPKPETCVILPDRPLNAPISTSKFTPALATLPEHSMRRLQGLNYHLGEDSLSLRMRNHFLSRLRDTA